jgi:hypothetical protein
VDGALSAGDYLIADNTPIHRGEDSNETLQCILDIFGVPTTVQPELNPCELVFSLIKCDINEFDNSIANNRSLQSLIEVFYNFVTDYRNFLRVKI